MRINKWLAANSDLSRRKADEAVANGRVYINGSKAKLGSVVDLKDDVELDGHRITVQPLKTELWMLNKPTGYVCSREGQGSQTIYELLPAELQNLKPVGRLDKNSSGLLLLTNNGELLNELSHPNNNHIKRYKVWLAECINESVKEKLEKGVDIGDPRLSRLKLAKLDSKGYRWEVSLTEGRNRQIRRSFEAVGNKVKSLHRIQFGEYSLGDLKTGALSVIIN